MTSSFCYNSYSMHVILGGKQNSQSKKLFQPSCKYDFTVLTVQFHKKTPTTTESKLGAKINTCFRYKSPSATTRLFLQKYHENNNIPLFRVPAGKNSKVSVVPHIIPGDVILLCRQRHGLHTLLQTQHTGRQMKKIF